MKCLGIVIKKNEIYYSVVEGESMSTAVIIEKGRHNFKSELPTPSLMADFYNIFTELITKFKPDRVAYKLHLDSIISQIPYMHFSLGILNFVCHQNDVITKERSTKWIIASKKVRIIKTQQFFEKITFKNESLWATLIAWFELES